MSQTKSQFSILRYPLLAVALFASLAAMWAGLLRLGWKLPLLLPTLALTHSPLMVSGFMGTLINLERVIALNRKWMYAAPAMTGLGVFALLIGLPAPVGAALMVLGSLGMVAIFAVVVRMHRALHTVTMALGAVAWLIGNVLWLMGLPVFRIVLWWGAFLILTIAGERLEMSRVTRVSRSSRTLFAGIIVLLFAGLAFVGLNLEPGWRVTGVAMLAMSARLLRYDVARRTARQSGLTRFIALNLLASFVWLAASGVLLIVFGQVFAGPRYDAVLHTLLLGFVFGMIFGHAPIILPAVLRVPMTYRPAFYSHGVLLHLSLVVRITGDLTGDVALRQWGGLFNVFAVLLFLFNTLRVMVQARRVDDHAQINREVSVKGQSRVGTFMFGIGLGALVGIFGMAMLMALLAPRTLVASALPAVQPNAVVAQVGTPNAPARAATTPAPTGSAMTPIAMDLHGGSSLPAGQASYTPNIAFTLKTGIAEGRLVFVGVGGDIEGVVNPALKVKTGDVVQVTLVNGDGAEHDVSLPDFNATSDHVVGKGASSVIVFRADKQGEFAYFCTLPGHRAAGMEGKFIVGAGAQAAAPAGTSIVRDPTDLSAPIGKRAPQTVQVSLETYEVEGQLADGVTYTYYTFNGKVPGPFIRVRMGDTVQLSLKNRTDSKMIHSIDLHAVTGPGGGANLMQVPPGQEKTFTFKAVNAGLFVYHCATPMVAQHLANGMYGLILVEPEEGLPKVDREFYVMQGEIYTQGAFGQKGHQEFSVDKLLNERPEYFVLNGAVGSLTAQYPLQAKVGETVRIFYGVGGPNFTSSFHVIGEILDRVYNQASLTSAPLTDVQTTLVPPGGATMVEFKLDVPGRYILVDHALSRLERGLAGFLIVEGPLNPDIYREGK